MRQRLDPRAIRAARQIAGAGRPRFDLRSLMQASGRPRRDPRLERDMLVTGDDSPAGRIRLSRDVGGRGAGATRQIATMTPSILRVDDPACLVLAVADLPDGRLDRVDRQVLGAARLLADAASGAVVLLTVAPITAVLAEDAALAGVDRLLAAGVETGWQDPEALTISVCAALDTLSPRHVLFADTPDGGDLARRVAARRSMPLFSGVEALSARQAVRPSKAGQREWVAAPPALLTLSADRVAAYSGARREARVLESVPRAVAMPGRVRAGALRPADPTTMPLGEAPFVTAAGHGVRDFTMFNTVVQALHATAGASRMVCDAGLMPRAAQVGASGTVLDALCYFAIGISGAPQHLQGIGSVEHVVAVNTDLHAAMIARAGLAIVADAQPVMAALLAELAREDTGA